MMVKGGSMVRLQISLAGIYTADGRLIYYVYRNIHTCHLFIYESTSASTYIYIYILTAGCFRFEADALSKSLAWSWREKTRGDTSNSSRVHLPSEAAMRSSR